MTLDLTKPVQTRGGRPVRIICTDLNDSQPVVGIVAYDDGEVLEQWCLDGRYLEDGAGDGAWDLINVPQKHVKYLNVYQVWPGGGSGEYWDTRDQADHAARSDRIACIRVEFKEGQFDD